MTSVVAGGTRSERKREAILTAARTAFLRNGYSGTTMDEIAAAAAVSKQTVYKHFADKQRLFTEIITGDIAATERLTDDLLASLPDSADRGEFERRLHEFARRHIADVTRPHLLRMRRLIIGEADRFPELARTWYERGPARSHTTLAQRFTQLAERGLLRVPDPLLAAQHFNWLVLSVPLNQAMFHTETSPSTKDLRRYADEAVRIFLAAYGPQP